MSRAIGIAAGRTYLYPAAEGKLPRIFTIERVDLAASYVTNSRKISLARVPSINTPRAPAIAKLPYRYQCAGVRSAPVLDVSLEISASFPTAATTGVITAAVKNWRLLARVLFRSDDWNGFT